LQSLKDEEGGRFVSGWNILTIFTVQCTLALNYLKFLTDPHSYTNLKNNFWEEFTILAFPEML